VTDIDVVFGTALAEIITSDPAWPGLVAAISAADPHKWTPRDLLHVAAEQLADATDEDHPIPPGDYARLITYTVDAFTHRLQARLGVDLEDLPTPQDAPPDPAEEALFPPDPQAPYAHVEEHPPLDDYFDLAAPEDVHAFKYGSHEFEDLRFEDLSTHRPTPELGITMDAFIALRAEYRNVCDEIQTLTAAIRAGNGPALRAAADDLLCMRRQVDADRPYSHAVTDVIEQWSDADAAYNDTLRLIEHSRTQLDLLLATSDADELDIISARQQIAFYTDLLPDQPPALKFQHALADAQAARAAAAGGADKIVTERDIAAARGDAERADLAALNALRVRRPVLRRELQRAERDIATAFAAAQTSTSHTLEQLLESARSEVALLQVAGHLDPKRTPLLIPDAVLFTHDPHIVSRLKSLTALPYRLAVIRADITDSDTAAALYTLRSTANAADRSVLWLSASDTSTDTARGAELADTITTIGHAHHQLSEQHWALPPGTIVVIDDPATAEPAQLVDIARQAAAADARVIFLDHGDASRGPSSAAVRLLTHSLPWNTTLTDAQSAPEDPVFETIPAVTLADRLGRTGLSDSWRRVLTQYDNAARAVRSAHRRNLALGWRTQTRSADRDPALGASIDD
jgi:hypothetical protein